MLKTARVIDLPSFKSALRIPASEFARMYGKRVQTVHNWAKTGVIKDHCGCDVQLDATRHLFIVVPPSHQDHKRFIFRKYIALFQKPEVRRRIEQVLRGEDHRVTPNELLLCMTVILWQVTGSTGLEPVESHLTLAELDEIDRRFKIMFSPIITHTEAIPEETSKA